MLINIASLHYTNQISVKQWSQQGELLSGAAIYLTYMAHPTQLEI